jgi:tRNA A37 threonylcarbamoyladenosine biosynthesis protein TsaE
MREAEMAQVDQRWTRVLYGERQLVFLTGEAGVGKTTLVEVWCAKILSSLLWTISHPPATIQTIHMKESTPGYRGTHWL